MSEKKGNLRRHRLPYGDDWTMIPNAYITQGNLTDSAFRLLVWMESVEIDDYEIDEAALALNWVHEKVKINLIELEDLGYVKTKGIRGEE